MKNIWKSYKSSNKYEISISARYKTILDENNNRYSLNLQAYQFPNIFMNNEKEMPLENRSKQEERIDFLQEEQNKPILNVLLHYIAQIDMLNAMTLCEFWKRRIYEEIENGGWGEYVKKEFNKLSKKDRDIILYWLVQKERNSAKDIYEEVIKDSFKNPVLYYDAQKHKLLIMFAELDTNGNKQKYKLIKKLFKELFLTDIVYWSCKPIIFDETTYRFNSIKETDFYNLI